MKALTQETTIILRAVRRRAARMKRGDVVGQINRILAWKP